MQGTEALKQKQREICAKFGSEFVVSPSLLKIGINPNVKQSALPLNGLRHPPQGDASGWYIWAGKELEQSDDFFVPLHISHLEEWCPDALPFLGLAPGWRFLKAHDYVDVWFDAALLNV